MNKRLLLSKLLVIVYNRSFVGAALDIDSNVREHLSKVNSDVTTTDNEIYIALSDLVRRIGKSDMPYSKGKIIAEVKILTDDNVDWVDPLHDMLIEDMSDMDRQRAVLSDLGELKRSEASESITNIFSKATFELKHNRNKILDVNKYVADILAKLETHVTAMSDTDAAITMELDLSDNQAMLDIFKTARNLKDGTGVLRFGFQALNTALQGGIRPGDFMMVGSLEHNYKSSLVRTLFRQIGQLNVPAPYPANATKKPLLWFVSFEDPLVTVIQFLFQNIKFNETRQKVNISDYKDAYMVQVVTEVFTQNGWNVKFMRVNPTEWTYRDIISKILSFIAEGYDIKVAALDYLLQIPTTGCDQTGATGTDLRDLLRRVRNFLASKEITGITPGQLSTQVKDKLINGTSERDLLVSIAERGMYAGSKQLTHDIDINLMIKKVKAGKKMYLDMIIDKHRAPTAIDDDLKHFAYEFPEDGMPIPDDIEMDKPTHVRKIPAYDDFM